MIVDHSPRAVEEEGRVGFCVLVRDAAGRIDSSLAQPLPDEAGVGQDQAVQQLHEVPQLVGIVGDGAFPSLLEALHIARDTYRYLHNLQGDIVAILDSNGNVMVEYRYDAWGKPIDIRSTLTTELAKFNPFRYRGYVYDTQCDIELKLMARTMYSILILMECFLKMREG